MRSRSLLRWLVGATLAFIFAFFLVTFALLSLARWIDPPLTALQLQRCLASALGGPPLCGRPTFVALTSISPNLREAVVAAEDARFFQHSGVDWQAMRDAAEANYRRGRLWRGGSTLTQQLVKNLFFGTHGGFARKAIEIPLALMADALLSKERQLEIYLNVVEWGPAVFGAEKAARYHYHRAAADLTKEQAARLAALLPSPLRRTPSRVGDYSDLILRRMSD